MSRKLLPKETFDEIASNAHSVSTSVGILLAAIERYGYNEREMLDAILQRDTIPLGWIGHFEDGQARIERDLEHVIPQLKELFTKLDALVKTEKRVRRHSRPIVDRAA